MKRKGISPILASVLLLAVTLSVVGIFSGWAPNIAQQVTESTSNNTEHQLECNRASVKLVSGAYDGTNDWVNITVRNNGRVDMNGIILAAFDSNDLVMAQNTVSIEQGNLSSESITGVTSTPSYVKAYSDSCGSVSDTLETLN